VARHQDAVTDGLPFTKRIGKCWDSMLFRNEGPIKVAQGALHLTGMPQISPGTPPVFSRGLA
jgi:hypothetical protein